MDRSERVARMMRMTAKLVDQGFDHWLEIPSTKLILSLIPPAHPPEALRTLLRDCWDAGCASGQASVMVTISQAMQDRNDDEKGGRDA